MAKRIVGVVLTLILLCPGALVRGEQVVVVLLSFVDIEDITPAETPTLWQLANQYTAGLINNRTGGTLNLPNAYGTLAAGSRMRTGPQAELALERRESVGGITAEELWTSLQGGLPAGEVLLPFIAQTSGQGALLPYPVAPFALGQTLRDHGLVSAVVGNADVGTQRQRAHALITTDDTGVTPRGQLRDVLLGDPTWPYLYRTDYERLLGACLDLLEETSLLVVEPGDLVRLMATQQQISPERFRELLHLSLRRLDQFVQQLWDALPPNTLLVLPSLVPREEPSLSPVIVAGPGWEEAIIFSPTTRREGLVANYDLTSTILDFLDLPVPKEVVGLTITPKPAPPDKMSVLINMKERARTMNLHRATLIRFFIGLVIGTFSLYTLLLLIHLLTGWVLWAFRVLLLVIAAIPLALLLVSLLPLTGIPAHLLFICLSAGFVTLVASGFRAHPLDPFLFIHLLTTVALWVEILVQGVHFPYSPLGYDFIGGARFYGIGNEYMGVLVGTSLLGCALLLERGKDKFPLPLLWYGVVGILGLSAFAIAAPNLGANTGGAITAAMGGVLLLCFLRWGRFQWKHLVLALLATGGLLGFMGLVDALLGQEGASHFGRFAYSLLQGDFKVVASTILRKLNTNLKLVRYTIWSQVLLVCLGVTGLLMIRPPAIFQTLAKQHPHIAAGIKAAVISTFVTFLVNDSGVVSAATLLVSVTPTFLYLVGLQVQKEARS